MVIIFIFIITYYEQFFFIWLDTDTLFFFFLSDTLFQHITLNNILLFIHTQPELERDRNGKTLF